MKIPKFWLVIIVIGAILAFTNPRKEDHIDSIITFAVTTTYEDTLDEEDTYGAIWATLGASLAEKLIENFIEVDNYILFSIAKVKKSNESKIISYGILGNVFLSPKAKKALTE